MLVFTNDVNIIEGKKHFVKGQKGGVAENRVPVLSLLYLPTRLKEEWRERVCAMIRSIMVVHSDARWLVAVPVVP